MTSEDTSLRSTTPTKGSQDTTSPAIRSLSPRPLGISESIKSYIASGHGITFPIASRIRHALANTPLLDRIPQVRYIPPLALDEFLEAPDTRLADAPFVRLWHDICTFFQSLEYLPYALLPLRTARGRYGEGDEDDWKGDHESWRTKRDDVLVGLASVVQVLVLPIIPVAWAVLPGLAFLVLSLGCGGLNYALLKAIQGETVVHSKIESSTVSKNIRERRGEKWFFVNGIMTGYVGVQSAVDHLSLVFGRPVTGIHNRTTGFVGDIVECLIQRCFTYNTQDVRVAYDSIRACLIDDDVSKVVLLAHSQGGITASMVLDKLLTDLPRDSVGKLEIYTFGSAASHFSNPLLLTPQRKPLGEEVARRIKHDKSSDRKPVYKDLYPPVFCKSLSSFDEHESRHPEHYRPILNQHSASAREIPSVHDIQQRPTSRHEISPSPCVSSSLPVDASSLYTIADHNHPLKRTIPYIEHYANELDPIPRWGVLHSAADLDTNHYAGSVFVRLGASGHLFSKHYLAALFPADEDERGLFWDRKVQTRGMIANGVSDVRWGDGVRFGRRSLDDLNEGRTQRSLGDVEFVEGEGKTVRELGRLCAYVDGGCPRD